MPSCEGVCVCVCERERERERGEENNIPDISRYTLQCHVQKQQKKFIVDIYTQVPGNKSVQKQDTLRKGCGESDSVGMRSSIKCVSVRPEKGDILLNKPQPTYLTQAPL